MGIYPSLINQLKTFIKAANRKGSNHVFLELKLSSVQIVDFLKYKLNFRKLNKKILSNTRQVQNHGSQASLYIELGASVILR